MTQTLYMSKRLEKYHNRLEIGTFLGVCEHLPCLVVFTVVVIESKFDVNCHHFIYSYK